MQKRSTPESVHAKKPATAPLPLIIREPVAASDSSGCAQQEMKDRWSDASQQHQTSPLTPRRDRDSHPTASQSAPDRLNDDGCCYGSSSLHVEQGSDDLQKLQVPLTCSPTPRKKTTPNLQENLLSSSSSLQLLPPKSPTRQPSCCSSVSMSSDEVSESETASSFPSQVILNTPDTHTPPSTKPARIVLSFAQASILSPSTFDPAAAMSASLRRAASAPVNKNSHQRAAAACNNDRQPNNTDELPTDLVRDRWNSTSSEFGISTRRELVNSDDTASEDSSPSRHGNDDDEQDDEDDDEHCCDILSKCHLTRTNSMDMPVSVPRRRRSVSSSDINNVYVPATSHHSSSSRNHHYQQQQQQYHLIRRPRSSSLDEPAHVPRRRGSIRCDTTMDADAIPLSTSLPANLSGMMTLQNVHSQSMPTLPRRISSRDLAYELNERPFTDEDHSDDCDEGLDTIEAIVEAATSSAFGAHSWVLDRNESYVLPLEHPDPPSDMKRQSTTGSKVSSKTELIESSEDSTSGWSDHWSPTPGCKRYFPFHKAASLPSLTSTRRCADASHSSSQPKQQSHPNHRGLPSAVRRLVRRSRSESPTSQSHPRLERLIQKFTKVRKEPSCHGRSCSKDKYLPSTEFIEPSASLYLDQQQCTPQANVDEDSLVFRIDDLKKRRSSSSSGSQRSMFRSKLFGRS